MQEALQEFKTGKEKAIIIEKQKEIIEEEIQEKNIQRMKKNINLLDKLFKKTKATPHIYYLPLSENDVKLKMKNKS